MHLTDLCYGLIEMPANKSATRVTGLAINSAHVKAGDLFFAISGTRHDGRNYIKDAIASGAVAVVTSGVPLAKSKCHAHRKR